MEAPLFETNVRQETEVGKSTARTIDDLKASVAAAEAKGVNQLFAVETATPETPTLKEEDQTKDSVTQDPPKGEDTLTKTDVPVQFKAKDGSLDEKKILEANKHLEKSIKSKAERQEFLIKQNKELREKFRQTSVETKRLETDKPKAPEPQFDFENLTDEFRNKLTADYEKDAIGTHVQLLRAIARQEMDKHVKPLANRLGEIDERTVDRSQAEELDELIEQGNTWIADEGLGRFEKVFQERPYLLQSPTRFRDALRFMDNVSPQANNAPGQAQSRSPILGARSAVPPPTVTQPASPESSLESLNQQIRQALKERNIPLASELEKKAAFLVRAMHG